MKKNSFVKLVGEYEVYININSLQSIEIGRNKQGKVIGLWITTNEINFEFSGEEVFQASSWTGLQERMHWLYRIQRLTDVTHESLSLR